MSSKAVVKTVDVGKAGIIDVPAVTLAQAKAGTITVETQQAHSDAYKRLGKAVKGLMYIQALDAYSAFESGSGQVALDKDRSSKGKPVAAEGATWANAQDYADKQDYSEGYVSKLRTFGKLAVLFGIREGSKDWGYIVQNAGEASKVLRESKDKDGKPDADLFRAAMDKRLNPPESAATPGAESTRQAGGATDVSESAEETEARAGQPTIGDAEAFLASLMSAMRGLDDDGVKHMIDRIYAEVDGLVASREATAETTPAE